MKPSFSRSNAGSHRGAPPAGLNYGNAADDTGHLSVWLDGRLVTDLAGPTGAPGWVGWRVGTMGLNVNPKAVTVCVDDCALSRVRVGPTGLLSW